MGSKSVESDTVSLNLKRFLDSGLLSDFTIRIAGRQFKVHKLVLCAQSEYFSALLLNGKWMESDKNEIELKEDDPRAVEAMVRFMYDSGTQLGAYCHGETSPTILLTRIYAVAEKYQIPKLKEQAKLKFQISVQSPWYMKDFPQVIEEVYTTTCPDVRDLRDEVVRVTRDRVETLLKNDDFQHVLESQIGFAADMVRILIEKPLSVNSVKNDHCEYHRLGGSTFSSCNCSIGRRY